MQETKIAFMASANAKMPIYRAFLNALFLKIITVFMF